MKASELIKRLQAAIEEHGDLNVTVGWLLREVDAVRVAEPPESTAKCLVLEIGDDDHLLLG